MDELSLADYVAILRRWKKLFLAVTVVLLALALSNVLRWSNYRATAVVQIEQPEISASATAAAGTNPHDAVEALADQRISEIQQKVLSTASLVDVITKFDLYAGARKSAPIAAIADGMRRKIRLDLVSSTLANPAAGRTSEDLAAIAFKLSFDYTDPHLTQQVTDELASRFLDEDLKERRNEAKSTSDFLADQIATLEKSMSEQEKKISDYQKEHGDVRPDSLAFNQQAAANLNINLQSIDGQITTIEGNLGALRAQLAGVDPYSRVIADGQVLTTPSVQLKALQGQYAALTAQYGPDHPDVVRVRHQIEALQSQVGHVNADTAQLKAQITDLRTNLEAATKTYGPDHPDVIALKDSLQKLEDRLATEKTRAPAAGADIHSDADNPAYLQLVNEIRASQEQLKSLQTQRAQLQEQQQNYQKAVIENPEAAKEMAALSRDYDNAQLRYRELKEKKLAADMDEQMQQDRKGQRLVLIDPPQLPLHTQPGRSVLLLASFLLSLMGGFVSVIVAQLVTQGIVGMRQLHTITGAEPLAAIPHVFTQEERKASWQHIAKGQFHTFYNLIREKVAQRSATPRNQE